MTAWNAKRRPKQRCTKSRENPTPYKDRATSFIWSSAIPETAVQRPGASAAASPNTTIRGLGWREETQRWPGGRIERATNSCFHALMRPIRSSRSPSSQSSRGPNLQSQRDFARELDAGPQGQLPRLARLQDPAGQLLVL